MMRSMFVFVNMMMRTLLLRLGLLWFHSWTGSIVQEWIRTAWSSFILTTAGWNCIQIILSGISLRQIHKTVAGQMTQSSTLLEFTLRSIIHTLVHLADISRRIASASLFICLYIYTLTVSFIHQNGVANSNPFRPSETLVESNSWSYLYDPQWSTICLGLPSFSYTFIVFT